MQIHDFEIPDDPQDGEQADVPEFHIDSEGAANWYLRKLANIESEKQRIAAQAAKMLAALDADAQRLTRLYDGELQEYVRQELARQGNRRKSLHFLQGTTAFRTVPASVKVSDERAALAYARVSLPDAVRSVETLDTAKYREAAETALSFGEVLPGVETTPQRESFTVKFGKTD